MPVDPLLRQLAAPLSADFGPLGLRVRLETNHNQLLAAAQRCFAGYGPAPARAPDLTMRLLVHDHPETAIERPVSRSHGHLAYVALNAGNVAIVDLQQGWATGFVTAGLLQDSATLRVYILEYLLYVFVQRYAVNGREDSGFAGIHAACVARPGRNAVLLRARSGGGKSVLALASLQRGYCLTAEDVAWLYLDQGQLSAIWGAPWLLHLRPDAAALFPELAEYPTRQRPTGVRKIALELEHYSPQLLAPRAQPGILCFLQRHTGPSSHAEPLHDPALIAALFAETDGEESSVPRYALAVSQLLQRPCYLLHVGTSLDQAVAVLDTIAP